MTPKTTIRKLITTFPTLITTCDCTYFRSTLSQCKPDTDIISLKGLSCIEVYTKPGSEKWQSLSKAIKKHPSLITRNTKNSKAFSYPEERRIFSENIENDQKLN